MSAELLTARAEVLNKGKTLGTTQADIRDARDRLIVHGTSSLAIGPAPALLVER
jgi:acyl-coenzyme A thioesterase PaaI-like protein